MTTRAGRIGRPMGEIRASIQSLAEQRPVTFYDAAVSLQLSRVDASRTLYRMASAGSLVVVDHRPAPGARKMVPAYVAAPASPPATVEDRLAALLTSTVNGWVRGR